MKSNAFLKNVLAFCMPCVLLCTGCTHGGSETEFQPSLDSVYAVTAEMTYGERGSRAVCTLTRAQAGLWEAAFSEPASLSGAVLYFDESAVSASNKGLAFTVPKTTLPAKAMLLLTTDVPDSLEGMPALPCRQGDNETWTLKGESEGGSYTLMFDKNGEFSEFSIPSQPLKVTFPDYCAGKKGTTAPAESSAAETDAATAKPAETTAGSRQNDENKQWNDWHGCTKC